MTSDRQRLTQFSMLASMFAVLTFHALSYFFHLIAFNHCLSDWSASCRPYLVHKY